MRFEPMQFGNTNYAIKQTNRCNPFQFTPATRAIPLFQKGKYTDTFAYCYRFDVGDIANDFELLREPLYLLPTQRAKLLSSLHMQQHFALVPQIFQPVIIAQIRGEEVYHDRAVVHHHPAILRIALHAAFVVVHLPHFLQDCIRQGIQHPVAGGGAEHEIICKRSNLLDI